MKDWHDTRKQGKETYTFKHGVVFSGCYKRRPAKTGRQ